MSDRIDWKAESAAEVERSKKRLSERAQKDSVSRDFYRAAIFAMELAEEDGLLPSTNEFGERRYSASQGLRAACHTRQDVAALVVVQRDILQRLQGLRMIGWACLALLTYIAVRIS